jgi:hypothetical protein
MIADRQTSCLDRAVRLTPNGRPVKHAAARRGVVAGRAVWQTARQVCRDVECRAHPILSKREDPLTVDQEITHARTQ